MIPKLSGKALPSAGRGGTGGAGKPLERRRFGITPANLPFRWILLSDPKGERDTQALLRTDPTAEPRQITECFIVRWQLAVTAQAVRLQLGVETQRQRTGPVEAQAEHAVLSKTRV